MGKSRGSIAGFVYGALALVALVAIAFAVIAPESTFEISGEFKGLNIKGTGIAALAFAFFLAVINSYRNLKSDERKENSGIRGNVYDENEMPIQGALVSVEGQSVSHETDMHGLFFLSVQSGKSSYTLTARKGNQVGKLKIEELDYTKSYPITLGTKKK